MGGSAGAVKLVCFDCDSTLSAVEGIDQLALLAGPEIRARVQQMTADAMEGRIRMEEVFSRRLEAIRPNRAAIEAVGRRYVDTVEPTAAATIATLRERGWTPAIVSAGYTQAIRPLADLLGVGRIEAVELRFHPDGSYAGFDPSSPCTRSGGKPEVLARLRRELGASAVAMVGDGVTDLETQGVADIFVGYGGYAVRERVRREAKYFIRSLAELTSLL